HHLLSMLTLFHIFFFNDTSTTEIYTLSLHDALPIWDNIMKRLVLVFKILLGIVPFLPLFVDAIFKTNIRMSIMDMTMQWSLSYRSEEHTSELQSRFDLVCRLLLEKKNLIDSSLLE